MVELFHLEVLDAFRGVKFRCTEVHGFLAFRIRTGKHYRARPHFSKELDRKVSQATNPENADTVCWADVVGLDDVENGRAA